MVKYPKGQGPTHKRSRSALSKQLPINYGSRGMTLEERINQANAYYLTRSLAVIHKKPTPIQVVRVDYPRRSQATITEAYYRHASTTDYNGIYQGHYVDFEVKETKNKTAFPLSNLQEHQKEHMAACYQQGGLVFLLISFKVHNEVYLMPYEEIDFFMKANKQKSLPYTYIRETAYLIPQSVFPPLDYLKAIDLYLHDKENLSLD